MQDFMRPDFITIGIAALCLAIWIYLLTARGRFWMASVRDDTRSPAPQAWPAVTVVIPARNEADCISTSVGSLLRQDYAGPLSVVVVDDDSDDGTGDIVKKLAASTPADRFVETIKGLGPP